MITKPTYDELANENKLLHQKLNDNESNNNYLNLFENNPLSLWEEDFSELIKILNSLKTKGLTNYKEYLDKNPDFVEKCIASIKILNVNQATLDLFKFDSNSILINNMSSVFNKQSLKTFKNLLGELIQGKANFSDETEFICANGDIINVIVECRQIINFEKVILNITDITNFKKAELALIESELRWKFAIEGNKDGLWDWNILTNEVFFSKQWKNMLGYTENEIPGNFEEWDKRVHPDDKEKVFEDIDKHIKGETKLYEKEYRMLCKDKTYKWILDRGKIISYTADNKPARMIGTHSDISSRKEAEHVLKVSEAKLRESNETKNKFFSIIAHDLKSPFNSMLGFSNLLNDNFDDFDTEKQKKFFSVIHDEIHKTYKLLDNLLLWSRSQSGTINFNPEKINLFLIINETVNLFYQTAKNKSITLTNEVSTDIFVAADIDMLSTIIRNLVSNAIKFTKRGGNVTITSKSETTKNKQKFIEIIIKDTGIGILKEEQRKLFDISKNSSTEGTENETGTGLGLILSKEFVEKHGGEIWVSSKIRKGSSFHFTIPV